MASSTYFYLNIYLLSEITLKPLIIIGMNLVCRRALLFLKLKQIS